MSKPLKKRKEARVGKSLGGFWLFYPPYFKGLNKPEPIVFYTAKAFNKFLGTLPKNWREKMKAKD